MPVFLCQTETSRDLYLYTITGRFVRRIAVAEAQRVTCLHAGGSELRPLLFVGAVDGSIACFNAMYVVEAVRVRGITTGVTGRRPMPQVRAPASVPCSWTRVVAQP